MFSKREKKKGMCVGFLTGLISAVGLYVVVNKAEQEVRNIVKCEILDRETFLDYQNDEEFN